jgi:hypothetical protein
VLALGENGQPVYASALQIRETLRLRRQTALANLLLRRRQLIQRLTALMIAGPEPGFYFAAERRIPFLRSGNLDAVLALGENGQPVYASALQIRETLRLRSCCVAVS